MGDLTESAGGLTDALGFLKDAGEESGELLDGGIGDIVDKVDEVTDLIEDIKPVLDAIQTVLA